MPPRKVFLSIIRECSPEQVVVLQGSSAQTSGDVVEASRFFVCWNRKRIEKPSEASGRLIDSDCELRQEGHGVSRLS